MFRDIAVYAFLCCLVLVTGVHAHSVSAHAISYRDHDLFSYSLVPADKHKTDMFMTVIDPVMTISQIQPATASWLVWVFDNWLPLFVGGVVVFVLGLVIMLIQMGRLVRQRTKALSKSEQQLRALIDAEPACVITADLDCGLVSMNASGLAMIEADSVEQVRGTKITQLVDKEYRKDFIELSRKVFQGESGVLVYSATGLKGRKIWLETSAVPFHDGSGKIIRLLGVTQDITERKHTEEALRRTQKMDALGKLTGGVAHDFNNLLGVILGYAEMLQNKLPPDPALIKYADRIYHAGELAKKLTTKLLAFSRIKTCKDEAVDVNQLLTDIRHMLEKSLTARIELDLQLSDALWNVCLDKDMLEDAILNMSINAMHAMPDGGVMTITTSNKKLDETFAKQLNVNAGDYVLLSLIDTGIGMNDDILKNIYDPFFSTKGEAGTGLGMSQVYGFVTRTGGGIHIDSMPDHGTEISIYLPRLRYKIVRGDHVAGVKKIKNYHGNEVILLVDDEIVLRELTAEVLNEHGYKVLVAESAEQALKILKTENVHLLLSDIIMPGMSGYQLADYTEQHYPNVKIQIISGFSSDHRTKATNDKYYSRKLQKPCSSEVLLKRVRELLDGERVSH